MMTDKTGAIISPCGKYRYRLWRRWDFSLPRVCWIMLNPSTADGMTDDATIRKCMGFTERLGYGGIEVVNLFAWRATRPQALKAWGKHHDVIGPGNDAAIKNAVTGVEGGGGITICAWGQHVGKTCRDSAVLFILKQIGVTPWVLQFNKGRIPAHPLMLPYSCPLTEWEIE